MFTLRSDLPATVFLKTLWGLPRWLSGNESVGSVSDLGGAHSQVLWSNQACVPQLWSLCSGAWEAQLLEPVCPTDLLESRRGLCHS